MEEYEEFFRRRGDYVVSLRFYECQDQITVEDLYQMFLSRMKAEGEEE